MTYSLLLENALIKTEILFILFYLSLFFFPTIVTL